MEDSNLGGDWPKILEEIASNVYSAVTPLLGTESSARVVGVGAGGDATTRIDAIAERVVIEYLGKNGISCILVAEESGVRRIGLEPEAYLVVDGIDGTTNAVRGIDFASTSIAVSPADSLDRVESAIVTRLDNGKSYTAQRGRGGRYDGKKIRPSTVRNLMEAVIAVDISRSPENLRKVLPLLEESSHIRCLGSASLEICQVASGHLDACVDVREKLRITDIAAAVLILREAGGLIVNPHKKRLENVPLTVANRFSVMAAANEEILNSIFQRLGDR